jgi:hypothetical protein
VYFKLFSLFGATLFHQNLKAFIMGFSLSPLHTNSLMKIIWSNNDGKAPKTTNINENTK